MRILIIRHAIAEDRELFAKTGRNDDLRPLTDKGRMRMSQAAKGLARLTGIDFLGHSPLTRAQQTADILKTTFPSAELLEIPELSPDAGPEAVAHWLGFVSDQATVALVGHEPDLGVLVAWLTTGTSQPYMHLKKAGVVMLECDGRPGPGTALMSWALPPRALRLLGGNG